MEFSQRSPTTVVADVNVDVVDRELFTLATQSLAEGCMEVPGNERSFIEFCPVICCCICSHSPVVWAELRELIPQGKFAKLSEEEREYINYRMVTWQYITGNK
jgi:hypothetical protein